MTAMCPAARRAAGHVAVIVAVTAVACSCGQLSA